MEQSAALSVCVRVLVSAGAFQHTLRNENPHDHLPRDGAAGLQHLPVDHRRLDCTSVREVSHNVGCAIFNRPGKGGRERERNSMEQMNSIGRTLNLRHYPSVLQFIGLLRQSDRCVDLRLVHLAM